MTNTHKNLQATHPDGLDVRLSETTTDSPILPVASLQQLAALDPKLVQWVVDQTQAEAEFRRAETKRINTLIFAERFAAITFGAAVAIVGLGISAYVAVNGHEWAASIIGGATLVAIVTVIVNRDSSAKDAEQDKPKPKRRKR